MTLSDPLTRVSRSLYTYKLQFEYLENGAFYGQSYYRTLRETIPSLSNGTTFNDLE